MTTKEQLARIEVLKKASGDLPGVYCPIHGKIANRWTKTVIANHIASCSCEPSQTANV